MSDIKWLTNMEAAMTEARRLVKPIFIFFNHPDCAGSKKSALLTFTNNEVVSHIERHFVPLNLTTSEEPDMSVAFNVELTPTFIVADEKGKELERWVGFLPPQDFIPQMLLSEGLASFHRKRFKDAESAFSRILDMRPESAVAPEARYYLGVTLYMETGDSEHLARTWETMHRRYPGDAWTKRASAWA
ncbi:MAG: thioredoxin fold domain-containing protein [Deltaproteobacteria bacterium]|nr:thioredoxin fold domain-containing protein [Deltaproteobacteria bacterium]